jgi:hypothetical protein
VKGDAGPLQPGVRYTVVFGVGPGNNFYDGETPWVRGEFTAKFRRLLRSANGDWPVLYFDNGLLLEGTAWTAVSAD